MVHTPGSDRSSQNVTKLRGYSSVPLRLTETRVRNHDAAWGGHVLACDRRRAGTDRDRRLEAGRAACRRRRRPGDSSHEVPAQQQRRCGEAFRAPGQALEAALERTNWSAHERCRVGGRRKLAAAVAGVVTADGRDCRRGCGTGRLGSLAWRLADPKGRFCTPPVIEFIIDPIRDSGR